MITVDIQEICQQIGIDINKYYEQLTSDEICSNSYGMLLEEK